MNDEHDFPLCTIVPPSFCTDDTHKYSKVNKHLLLLVLNDEIPVKNAGIEQKQTDDHQVVQDANESKGSLRHDVKGTQNVQGSHCSQGENSEAKKPTEPVC